MLLILFILEMKFPLPAIEIAALKNPNAPFSPLSSFVLNRKNRRHRSWLDIIMMEQDWQRNSGVIEPWKLNSSPEAHIGVRAVQIQSMPINIGHGNDPPGPDQECEMGYAPLSWWSQSEDASLLLQYFVLCWMRLETHYPFAQHRSKRPTWLEFY